MPTHRTDRVVRTLTVAVSIVYFGALVSVALLLVAVPIVDLFVDVESSFSLPVSVQFLEGTFVTDWNPTATDIELKDIRGQIELPTRVAPTSFRVLMWAASAVLSAVILVFLHHLRRLFQRVREGTPFDAQNATRLRWLGILLLAFHGFRAFFEFVMSTVVTRSLDTFSTIEVGPALHIDVHVVFIGLVLIALAEIYRRGVALESEQAVVV